VGSCSSTIGVGWWLSTSMMLSGMGTMVHRPTFVRSNMVWKKPYDGLSASAAWSREQCSHDSMSDICLLTHKYHSYPFFFQGHSAQSSSPNPRKIFPRKYKQTRIWVMRGREFHILWLESRGESKSRMSFCCGLSIVNTKHLSRRSSLSFWSLYSMNFCDPSSILEEWTSIGFHFCEKLHCPLWCPLVCDGPKHAHPKSVSRNIWWRKQFQ
jgi:hypothetical protein